jgi:hypothetical protein
MPTQNRSTTLLKALLDANPRQLDMYQEQMGKNPSHDILLNLAWFSM